MPEAMVAVVGTKAQGPELRRLIAELEGEACPASWPRQDARMTGSGDRDPCSARRASSPASSASAPSPPTSLSRRTYAGSSRVNPRQCAAAISDSATRAAATMTSRSMARWGVSHSRHPERRERGLGEGVLPGVRPGARARARHLHRVPVRLRRAEAARRPRQRAERGGFGGLTEARRCLRPVRPGDCGQPRARPLLSGLRGLPTAAGPPRRPARGSRPTGSIDPAPRRRSPHALRSHSQGSGGSASRIVTGGSLVAGQSLPRRPDSPHRR